MKKKLKKKILQILLYTIVYIIWTSMLVFGFLQNTIY